MTGCGQPIPATVAGADTFSIAINPATHTVYTGDSGGNEGGQYAISVLDAATCNTVVMTGCSPNPTAIPTDFNPYGVAVNSATDTLYVTNLADSSGNSPDTVSVIDGATCNASVTSGCAARLPPWRSAATPRDSPSTSAPTRSTSPTPATTRSR